MDSYRTLEEYSVDYFRQHPGEIDLFIQECFAEYAQDANSAALLSQLRVIARVKGVSSLAAEIGLTRQGLQKALSPNGNPSLDTINAIMRSFGYVLMPRKLAAEARVPTE